MSVSLLLNQRIDHHRCLIHLCAPHLHDSLTSQPRSNHCLEHWVAYLLFMLCHLCIYFPVIYCIVAPMFWTHRLGIIPNVFFWNYSIFVHHNLFEIYACWSGRLWFLFLHCYVILHHMSISLFIHFTIDEICHSFHCLEYYKNHCCEHFWTYLLYMYNHFTVVDT